MKNLVKIFKKPIFPTLIVLLLYSIFIGLFLSKNDYDVTSLIKAGNFFTETKLKDKIKVFQGTGYDAQFYYRLALHPFTDKITDSGIKLDAPLYRQQRILYPFIVWLLSFHQPKMIPPLLVVLNLFFLGIITYYGSLLAISFKKPALWGLAFSLYAGFLFTITRDLTEITAITFLLAGLTYLHSKRFFISGALLSLAVLAKETVLIVPLSILFVLFFQRPKKKKPQKFIGAILPIIVYGFWHIWLYFNWLKLGDTDIGIRGNIGFPFEGIFRFVMSIPSFSLSTQKIFILELFFIIIFIFLTIISIYKTRASIYITISWLIYLFINIKLTTLVWSDDYAFMRALSELYILGLIILLGAKNNKIKYIILSGIGLWFYLSVNLIYFR